MAVQKSLTQSYLDSDVSTPGDGVLNTQTANYVGTVIRATCTGVVYANRVVTITSPVFQGDPTAYQAWLGLCASELDDIVGDIDDMFGEGEA
jgi:hypothetical protein